jgi:chemotaxis protein CheX
MNIEYLNPFVEAASEVLQTECNIAVKRGALSLQKTCLTTDDVTVLISLMGQVHGVVLYGLSEKTSLNIVSRVMGKQFTVFDGLAQSGIAELSNVISGQATIRLSNAGFTSIVSPPTLIQGKGITVSTLDFSRIVIPLTTVDGDLTLHLALREALQGMQHSNFVPVRVTHNELP